MKRIQMFMAAAWAAGAALSPSVASAAEYFVAPGGDDAADGSAARPWRTIQRAADVAKAGDTVTIRGGTYREWVKPAHAGRADAPIVYRAAKGERVVVTGADPVTGWTRRPDGLWMAQVRYDSFRGMNPFTDSISGDWYEPYGKRHLRAWMIQGGKALKTHPVELFWDQNAHGRPIVNIDSLSFGPHRLKKGGKQGENGKVQYDGLNLSAPEVRHLSFRTSSQSTDAVAYLYDANSPTQLLTKVVLKATGGWDKFRETPATLPDSAAGVKSILVVVLFGGHSYKYDVAPKLLPPGSAALIPGMVTGRILAAFEQDPNVVTPELVTRPACFYPIKEHRDYITLRGIVFQNAAPNWGTANGEQVGVVGTHWSRGWVIEDCEVSGSSCDGIALGKHGDEFDNAGPFVRCYYDTIRRAASNGWERVGHHVVRRCKVSECGQSGIHSSLGAAFSTIEDCEIFHCNWKKRYGGADMAGLKLLCSVDVTIRNNRIHHNGGYGGIWLDWMSQGARVVGNRLWANNWSDVFIEVDHGPVLVEGNDMLSPNATCTYSQNVAFVGNRIFGTYQVENDPRCTPVFKPHSVTLESIDEVPNPNGAFVFMNNILAVDPRNAKDLLPSRYEDNWMVPAVNWKIDDATGAVTITPPAGSKPPAFRPVDSKRLGKPIFVDQEFPAPTISKPKL